MNAYAENPLLKPLSNQCFEGNLAINEAGGLLLVIDHNQPFTTSGQHHLGYFVMDRGSRDFYRKMVDGFVQAIFGV